MNKKANSKETSKPTRIVRDRSFPRKKSSEKEEPKVGYKNPPKEHQFRPGLSGNPGGRPVGRKKLATHLADVLNETTEIVKDGKRYQVERARALAELMVADALSKRSLPIVMWLDKMMEEADRIEDDVIWKKLEMKLGPVMEMLDEPTIYEHYLRMVAREKGYEQEE